MLVSMCSFLSSWPLVTMFEWHLNISIDDCCCVFSSLYVGNSMIIFTYVDDYIIIRQSMKNMEDFVKLTKNGSENFVLTDNGDEY